MIEFYIYTDKIEFEETKEKGARILATVMELEKPSKNNRVYQFEEGKAIASSLKGKPIYYGTDPFGRHCNPLKKGVSKECKDNPPVGFVETAKVVGKKIKAVIRIYNERLIKAFKNGIKYLFSVGGQAVSETLKKIGGKIVRVLSGAKCNHLQIVDKGIPVGFPSAKMEKLIEINETVTIFADGDSPVKMQKPKKKTVIVEETVEIEVSGVKEFSVWEE